MLGSKKPSVRAKPQARVDNQGRQIFSSGNIGFEDESFLRKIFFLHLNKIVNRGAKTPYRFDMLYELDDQLLYADYKDFEVFFRKNQQKYKKDVLGAVFSYTKR